jgi:transketolase
VSAAGPAELRDIACDARAAVVKAVAAARGGHVGGPLSATDVLVALYFRVLRIRPDDPEWPGRDRFVLSKGHSSVALYAVMALRGYFPIEEMGTFDAIDSRLQGHPDMTVLPGIDMSTGSLGLGFSAAVGMALGAKMQASTFATFVMVGDGECNEGSIWEGAHVAHRYGLDNLITVVDHNGLQQYGFRAPASDRRARPYEGSELAERWRAFGWRVLETDGHDLNALPGVLEEARRPLGRPTVVVAHTVKGKGVSFMEDDFSWHSRVPTPEELTAAMREIDGARTATLAHSA